MKLKAVIALGLSLVIFSLLLAVPANAMLARNNSVDCTLDFVGNTAMCSCEISTDSSSDWVSATMELWKGTSCGNCGSSCNCCC